MKKIEAFKSKVFQDKRGRLVDQNLTINMPLDFTIKHTFFSESGVGVIRGMHFQSKEAPQEKYIISLNSSIIDVCVDVRPESPEFGVARVIRLGPNEKYDSLYIPYGYAHGIQCLNEGALLMYFCSSKFLPSAYVGFSPLSDVCSGCWNSFEKTQISEKDYGLPDFSVLNFNDIV